MNAGTRPMLQVTGQAPIRIHSNEDCGTNPDVEINAARVISGAEAGPKPRVFVAAENRLVREALSRILIKSGEVEVVGMNIAWPCRAENLVGEETDVLVL